MSKNNKFFDWQGHRGCRGLYPENSIEGMKAALNYKINTLEMDVVISKDEQVVVSHEPWMSEEICLDPSGKTVKDKQVNLFKLNYNEIKMYDCGSKIHPRFLKQKKIKTIKPTLVKLITEVERYLNKTNKRVIKYNIEIKSDIQSEQEGFQPGVEKFTDLVILTLKKMLPSFKYSIQSFDWRVLNYLSNKYPEVNRVALIEEKYDVKTVLNKLLANPHVFSPDFNLLTSDDVNFLKAKNIKIIPWTVNTAEDMKKVKNLGVDGIITDYPNIIGEL